MSGRGISLSVLALALALSGCSDASRYSQEQMYPVKVQPETVTLRAPLGGGADPFTGTLADRFDTLVSGYLKLGHGPLVLSARPSPQSSSALARVSAKLVAAGVPQSSIRVEPASEGDAGVVTLQYQRFDLIPPTCPGWSVPMDYNYYNLPDPGLGCAMLRDSELMAADPATLVSPAPAASENPDVIARVGAGFAKGQPSAATQNPIQAVHDTSAAVDASGTGTGTGH
jgi:type IV pilus biogenesis protein CpaD/CtpE